jgi:hypothetical protein
MLRAFVTPMNRRMSLIIITSVHADNMKQQRYRHISGKEKCILSSGHVVNPKKMRRSVVSRDR